MMMPFSLSEPDAYQQWHDNKLSLYPVTVDDLFVNIEDPAHISETERSALLSIVGQYNMAFYRFKRGASQVNFNDKHLVHALGQQLGLSRLDNNLCADADKLTSIEVRDNKHQHTYIPYTNRRLSWHTDGYYNTPETQIRGVLLHCVRPAETGGENMLMDIELAYILLRDKNPDYIHALMQPDAMTIPANILNGEVIREAQSGPVFSLSGGRHLHMRYSARKRNIVWKDDQRVQEAAAFLQKLWTQDSPYIIRCQLKTGEGIICNNVLHNRTAFRDGSSEEGKRLLYRGRYYDRISET